MRLKALLALCAATLVLAACTADVTAPSTSRAPLDRPLADGPNTLGSGGFTDTTSTYP